MRTESVGTLVLLLGLTVSIAHGQTTSAVITGQVLDEQGAVIPGVAVAVTNQESGITRSVVSTAAGRYYVGDLVPGQYRVRAEFSGFNALVRSGIGLTVGRTAVVDLTLRIGEVTQEVQVTAEAPLVETTSSKVSGIVSGEQIRELPLNGRDIMQLALLQTAVSQVRNADTGVTKGFGPKISIAGTRPDQTSYSVDGATLNSPTNFGAPGSIGGGTLGVDTIREFEVLTSNYSAEFGRAAGGVINAVTRSGGNQFHGSVFEFLRNAKLDARNFFDVEKPGFKRNQFGASAGGPIVQNKLFFFGGYEGLRERLGVTNIGQVPTAAAREGNIPGQEPFEVNSSVRPFLSLFPSPNGRDLGGGVAELLSAGSEPTGENFVSGRIDYRMSDSDTLFGRYTFDQATQDNLGELPNYVRLGRTRSQAAVLEEVHVFSPTVVNLFRFSFSRAFLAEVPEPLVDIDPSLFFVPSVNAVGEFTFADLSNPGTGSTTFNRRKEQNTFQFQDSVTIVRGAHTMKLGGNFQRIQFDTRSLGFQQGRFRFDSLVEFLQGDSSRLDIVGAGDDQDRDWRQNLVGVFFQDDYRVRPGLTLNLGLRYEFYTSPSEINGTAANLRHFLDPEITVGDPLFLNPSLKDFAPRVGLAWDPTGTGRTAVRAGFGMFYDVLFGPSWANVDSNPPLVRRFSFRNPEFFPDANANITPEAGFRVRPTSVPFDINAPYIMKWNLTVEKQLGAETTATIGYVGHRGVHLTQELDANTAVPEILPDGRKFFPADAPQRNPNFLGGIIVRSSTQANSFYHGLRAELRRRFFQGLQFQVSYTLSKTIDEGAVATGSSDFGGTGIAMDAWNLRADRSLSSLHVAHVVTVNYAYELPVGPGRLLGGGTSGVAGKLLGDWQVMGIVSANTGQPFPVQISFNRSRDKRTLARAERPNLVAGRSNNPVLGGPDQYFDPSAFELPPVGFYGNLGRNTIIGPGTATVDFSLVKNTSLSENTNLQFRAEAFNLFNRANFAFSTPHNIFTRSGVAAGAGRITNTVTTSRQIQFGLKFLW